MISLEISQKRTFKKFFISKPVVKAADSGNPLLFLQPDPGNVLMEERPNTQSQRCAFWHGSSVINEMQT